MPTANHCWPCRGTGRSPNFIGRPCGYCRGEGECYGSTWDGVVRACVVCVDEAGGEFCSNECSDALAKAGE